MKSLDQLGPQLAEVELVVFDFDGVFTDNTVLVSQDGVESVTCWRSDGLGLSRLASLGVQLAIISTENNPVVSARARKLRLQCVQGVADKCGAVRELCVKCGVAASNTMYVGNDINDVPALEAVGWPVAVADAYPEVFPHVRLASVLAAAGSVPGNAPDPARASRVVASPEAAPIRNF